MGRQILKFNTKINSTNQEILQRKSDNFMQQNNMIAISLIENTRSTSNFTPKIVTLQHDKKKNQKFLQLHSYVLSKKRNKNSLLLKTEGVSRPLLDLFTIACCKKLIHVCS